MKGSYENDIHEKIKKGEFLPGKLDIPLLKYFWQSSPLLKNTKGTVPRFMRKIKIFQDFSDYELRTLSRSMHLRNYSIGETIFTQGDVGIGFYFIYSGRVDIIVEKDQIDPSATENLGGSLIVSLDKSDYFGELALLQEGSVRSATAVAAEPCQLIGIFKPDLENLIQRNSTVATKLLRAVSVIVSNRLFSLTTEIRRLKNKIKYLEEENDKEKDE